MPNTEAAIDQLLQDGLELDLTDSYVTTEWRPRALKALQKAVADAYLMLPPGLRRGTADLALVGPATEVDLPADFGKTGFKGGLRIPATARKVHYLTNDKFDDMVNAAGVGGGQGEPEFYTHVGVSTTTLRRKVALHPAPASGTTTIRVRYEKMRPTLIDADTLGANGLELVPEDLYETAIYLGALDWLLSGVADGRATQEMSPRFKAGMDVYLSTVQDGQEELQQYGEEGVPELGMW